MTTATYPVEEPTVFGTLFEQVDPWDTIGQILGLPNAKPSKSPGGVVNELSDIDRSGISSAVIETKEEEDLMSADDIPELQYSPLLETGLQVSSRYEIDRQGETESAGTAFNQCPQQEIAQVSETGEIEDKQLMIDKEYESALAIPELEESDGLFVGPSLFELDKDEDEI